MTLHSQTPFNFHNEHMGRGDAAPIAILKRYTPEQSRALENWMIDGIPRAGHSRFEPTRGKGGRPSQFTKYEDLFHKRGEMTTNDVVTQLGKPLTAGNRRSTGTTLKYFWDQGLLERSQVEGLWIWRLAETGGEGVMGVQQGSERRAGDRQ